MNADLKRVLDYLVTKKDGERIETTALAKALGMNHDVLEPILKQLFESKYINMVDIIKNGVQFTEIWRTGMTYIPAPVSTYSPKPSAPGRVAPVNVSNEPKSTVGKLLYFLENNRDWHLDSELAKQFGIGSAQQYLKTHIKTGDVLLNRIEWGKTYLKMADGVSSADCLKHAEVRLKDARKKVSQHIAAEIPSQTQTIVKAVSDAKLAPPTALEYSPSPQFRLAITNDGCLLMFGIGPQVIELSAEQTSDLRDFIEDTLHVT